MARNDVVILDSLVEKAKGRLGKAKDDSELFELFVFDQILKDYDLSYEELETGWTDGGDDGGIDGFYVLVDGRIATDDVIEYATRRHPKIDVHIFSVRRTDSFELRPIDALFASLAELLDLTKIEKELSYPYNQDILDQRALFAKVIVGLADRQPNVSLCIDYCSRGATVNLPANLQQRARATENLLKELFSDTDVTFNFIGATELLLRARQQLTYTLKLAFAEPPVTRDGRDYLLLATLDAYATFITDDEGKLRRYLFESNVRDYLGEVQVNTDIANTLKKQTAPNAEDFWWLNNGVTILATRAYVIGKELYIENVQIVNGLQTTETIYRHFAHRPSIDKDDRAVLVKVIQTEDDEVRSRIIKATNYQSSVDLASLRGLDKIQRDIEDLLLKHGWFYDRRKNFYKNQSKPIERIVTVPYLAAAVRAIALADPARSQRQRSKSLRDETTYRQIFDERWDIEVFLVSLEVIKVVEAVIHGRSSVLDSLPIALVHYLGYLWTCNALGTPRYRPNEVARLAGKLPSTEELDGLKRELAEASVMYNTPGRRVLGITLNKELFEKYLVQKFGKAAVVGSNPV